MVKPCVVSNCLLSLLCLLSLMGLWFPVVLCQADSSSFSTSAQSRTITTTGEATINVAPDEVVLRFGVETFDLSLKTATESNAAASSVAVAAVRALGIEECHIKTDTLTVDIRYKEKGYSPFVDMMEIAGYVAKRSYTVTLKDTALFERTIDAVLSNGANILHGFEFRSTELRKHRDEARRLAAVSAKEKAQLLASTLDSTVGKPLTITETPQYNFGTALYSQNARSHMGRAVQSGGDQTLPLGQIAIVAGVTVSFELL